ncbi:MAG: bifunctional glutamate N-acetyltransferase/amino-acid acetyltransferase ArgJ [Verrucomicrobiae bacterium]|nr:bifunctional glutamate N-acetyltransferase/amino-acid acetyltransferase ArgJ [Verrucomicrobiae bacterium]MDW7979286.1 bifunctional glutamate N-acetyltransferase/amino-acid acetyltransferase ArgJ [Verrucomicrobiales bacterium]
MKIHLTTIPGSVVAPRGFLASGVFCDIKRLGTGKGSEKGQKRDLALIVSTAPATCAGMFTTNQVCAAPVKLCIQRVKRGRAQAIVANSGNANACTGARGFNDALEMARCAAEAVSAALKLAKPLDAEAVLVGSTGRIGVPLPMQNVRRGILAAAEALGHTPEHAAQAAEAIMTSDTYPKQIAVEFDLGNKPVRIGGIAKGAGMIHPAMSRTGARPAALAPGASAFHATMLCFITTDAAIAPGPLQTALEQAVANSFNRITVDGDTSTNDTVLVLANGLAGNRPISKRDAAFEKFQAALSHVCAELAKMIVRDGEGVHRVVTVRVTGARTLADADVAARAVANSPLVKTSWHGGDPNWGRVMAALGYSAATVVEEKVDIGYSAPGSKKVLWCVKRGRPTQVSFANLCAAVAQKQFELHINLNLGKAGAVIYATDLTEQYVEFNKGDLSAPGTPGG